MNETQIKNEISLLELAIVLAKHKRLLLGLPILVAVVALVVVLLLPKIYTASTRILPPQQSQSIANAALGALTGVAGSASGSALQALGLKNPSDLYVGILNGRTIADRMIERFSLQRLYEESTMVGTRGTLAAVTRITAGRDGLITIEVDDEDPKRAADMANAYVEELDRLVQGLAVTEAAQRRLFFERELNSAREKLASAEVDMRKMQEKTGLIQLEGQARAILEVVMDLRARIAAKEVEIAAFRTFSTEANPALTRARQELSSLKGQLLKLERSQGRQSEGDILVPTGKVPEVGLEYLRRARDLKYQETLFELLARQFEMAKIDEAKDAALIQVVDSAVAPDHKSKPNRAKIVILLGFTGVAFSILLAFLMESISRTVKQPAQAARLQQLRNYLKWQ